MTREELTEYARELADTREPGTIARLAADYLFLRTQLRTAWRELEIARAERDAAIENYDELSAHVAPRHYMPPPLAK